MSAQKATSPRDASLDPREIKRKQNIQATSRIISFYLLNLLLLAKSLNMILNEIFLLVSIYPELLFCLSKPPENFS